MAFVQFTKVSLAFGDRDILKDVNLNLAAGSRSALAGTNGSGKSTLMKVIAGKLTTDRGERAVQKGCRISYLPQSGIVHQGKTLREEAETAYAGIIASIKEMENIGRSLETVKTDNAKTAALLTEYHRLQEGVESSGYYGREQQIAMVLYGLGFSEEDLGRRAEEFSGGWQMRIALAKVLLERPEILLLDEPTNYLDIEARSWLEQWLRNFPGGYLLVSHDRYFLDVTVTEVYELFQGHLKRYAGNYTAYEKVRQTELEGLLKRYTAQQEEIVKSEELIRRFRYKASKAAMVQERIKRLEKMERIEIPESLKKISIQFPPPPHSGRTAMTLEGIGKRYGDRPVLGDLNLLVEAGEKLVVVGRNGSGKTTLLRILAGADTGFTGKLSCGTGIQTGYFSQDAAETMTGSAPVLEYLEAETPTHLVPKIRDMLGAFLFRGDDVYKPISVLSGGEKSRLALLRMFLTPINLLIMDEPTNHLDLHSKDILLDTLQRFKGTIIFVSHDRSFMEALSTKTLELTARAGRPAAARLFYGNYAYYLDRIERENAGEYGDISVPSHPIERPAASVAIIADTAPEPPADPCGDAGVPEAAPPGLFPALPPRTILIKAAAVEQSAADRRATDKQRQALIRRLRRQEEEILKALEDLEKEKIRLEGELARPEIYSSGGKARAVKNMLDETAAELERLNREWEEKAAELEAIKNSQMPPAKPGVYQF